jgi:hypothetical protein
MDRQVSGRAEAAKGKSVNRETQEEGTAGKPRAGPAPGCGKVAG